VYVTRGYIRALAGLESASLLNKISADRSSPWTSKNKKQKLVILHLL